MNAVLGLRLVGPMQAWGSASRFATRGTDDAPTKSGVIGLLAAAKGKRRTDPVGELTSLRFGVRIEQPGKQVRDFQTAASADRKHVMPLSYRNYLADARFMVGLEGEREFLDEIADALVSPAFPLYLGRRSCPPSEPLIPWIKDVSLEEFLLTEPWIPADWWLKKQKVPPSTLEFRIDAHGASSALAEYIDGERVTRDEVVTFDPEHRKYTWRRVLMGTLPLPDGPGSPNSVREHDPFTALE